MQSFRIKFKKEKLQSIHKPSIFDSRLQMSSLQMASDPSLNKQTESPEPYPNEHHNNDNLPPEPVEATKNLSMKES